jgi:hypothetical protein
MNAHWVRLTIALGSVIGGAVVLIAWCWAMMDISAAHPTHFETMQGAGKVCTRMVEERWYGTQVVSFWDCQPATMVAPLGGTP